MPFFHLTKLRYNQTFKLAPKASFHLTKRHYNYTFKLSPKASLYSTKWYQTQTLKSPQRHLSIRQNCIKIKLSHSFTGPYRCQNSSPSLLLKFILQNALSLPNMCPLSRSMQPKLLMFAFYFIVEYVLLRIVKFKFSFVWNVLELRARTSCNILRKSTTNSSTQYYLTRPNLQLR